MPTTESMSSPSPSRKLFICPYFGELPPWFDKYQRGFERIRKFGYDMLLETDLERFGQRVGDVLGIELPELYGTRKLSDLRAAFGLLYADEIGDAEFWGITDFDCVYGRVDKFVTEAFLSELDIHSNHKSYVCGPWTLFRNTPKVNSLFREHDKWQFCMSDEAQLGWLEREYTELIDLQHAQGLLRREYTHWQSKNANDLSGLHLIGDSLYDGRDEIMMAHFNRSKRWPNAL